MAGRSKVKNGIRSIILSGILKSSQSGTTRDHVLVAKPKSSQSGTTRDHVLVAKPKSSQSGTTRDHILVAKPSTQQTKLSPLLLCHLLFCFCCVIPLFKGIVNSHSISKVSSVVY
ncbi:hypothetical protein DPMN_121575 [Dreissena polymorpha]|uniref:Uncharacterized protein n=1 Tax=Dreissena polymorpha TaxID=45954 RepID=A0A9D4JTN8_DREPO|nr:hypothetical protein DPMN_121575 [Dreissena polymorpha]